MSGNDICPHIEAQKEVQDHWTPTEIKESKDEDPSLSNESTLKLLEWYPVQSQDSWTNPFQKEKDDAGASLEGPITRSRAKKLQDDRALFDFSPQSHRSILTMKVP